MKWSFEKEFADLKRLEALAKLTGIEADRKVAEIKRGLLMSYKGMTRELEAFTLAQGGELLRHVSKAVENKDVEEIHRLWVKYCEGK